jgi:cardiolipin synthase
MLDAGVLIHEMEHAVMHAKTAVIDGVLSTVGSSNMDWRSFVMNSELNVLVLGDDFGREMEALFARDRAASPQISPAAWAKRSWWQKLQQRAARWLEPLL